MNVPPFLTDVDFVSATVPTLIGTPPQQNNLTVDISSGLLAAYAYDCVLCAGPTSFDSSLSSTFKSSDIPWNLSTPSFSGTDVTDTVGFGDLFNVADQSFVNINDGSSIPLSAVIWGGHLGLFPNPLNAASASTHLLTRFYQSSSLLNPVIGMRFDPANPKLTIGALDPNDYQGTINWVEMTKYPDPNGDYYNTFNLDGVKGSNGEFVPFGGNLTAALSSRESRTNGKWSLFLSIAVPNAETYFLNPNFTGPVPRPISLVPEVGNYQYNCTPDPSSSTSSGSTPPQSPYVAFTASINGVDYQIDSVGNLLRPQSGISSLGYCPVGIRNRSDTLTPNVVFGLPFLRSVYVAYRFPTDTCPGYYGFAFPSGSNRTQSQISQTPTLTPTNSAQCLSLTAPTSTPTANVVLAQKPTMSKETYSVYGRPGVEQVSLLGVDDMPNIVWNWTDMS
ncbi:aspartic peptidase domain-containing protein [Melanogaster broomeanus]|nr:aspartic peptidase domain-containing protein [Melanogaster broomeanus]